MQARTDSALSLSLPYPSGGLGWHVSHGQVIGGAAFAENLPCCTGTTTALRANTELLAKLAHGTDAIVGGFTDFSVCYTMAEAYVHRSISLTITKLVIIIVICMQLCKPKERFLCKFFLTARLTGQVSGAIACNDHIILNANTAAPS